MRSGASGRPSSFWRSCSARERAARSVRRFDDSSRSACCAFSLDDLRGRRRAPRSSGRGSGRCLPAPLRQPRFEHLALVRLERDEHLGRDVVALQIQRADEQREPFGRRLLLDHLGVVALAPGDAPAADEEHLRARVEVVLGDRRSRRRRGASSRRSPAARALCAPPTSWSRRRAAFSNSRRSAASCISRSSRVERVLDVAVEEARRSSRRSRGSPLR